ncbi:MAG TPA: hypothetical protein VM597_10255 [Gemmataceae bacterium]|jgi:hypothetical protein|nr:hypothetical protein [Gemmataceae bacterium]
MTVLRFLSFAFGYMTGGMLAAVAVMTTVSALWPGPAHPPPAWIIVILVTMMGSGIAAGAFCVGLFNRLTRREPVHPDYDDRPGR